MSRPTSSSGLKSAHTNHTLAHKSGHATQTFQDKVQNNEKILHSTNSPYEAQFGFHRAVRKGPFVFVSGTTSLRPYAPFGVLKPGDAPGQAEIALKECIKAIEALGGQKSDICRVRVFVARKDDCRRVGNVMKTMLGDVGTAASMLVLGQGEGCGGFVDEKMVVEIEMDAIIY